MFTNAVAPVQVLCPPRQPYIFTARAAFIAFKFQTESSRLSADNPYPKTSWSRTNARCRRKLLLSTPNFRIRSRQLWTNATHNPPLSSIYDLKSGTVSVISRRFADIFSRTCRKYYFRRSSPIILYFLRLCRLKIARSRPNIFPIYRRPTSADTNTAPLFFRSANNLPASNFPN